jgi:hypothetical protein
MGRKINRAIIIICLLAVSPAFGSGPAGIREVFEYFTSQVPSQKVFLHTDKAEYRSGEIIWLKAYVFDGENHILWSDTSNVYIELINAEGNTMAMRILLSEEGFASGEIGLRTDFPDGNYILRAYTDWMMNFSDDFYYKRYLYINNPGFDDIVPRGEMRRNRRFNRQLRRMSGEYQAETFPEKVSDFFFNLFTSGDPSEYQAAFFPEGGNLVEGIPSRVAFKMADALGYGIEASAEITDNNGAVVATFSTDRGGIGVFEILPEKGNIYNVTVTSNGRTWRYELPEAAAEGFVLRVDNENGHLRISAVSTLDPSSPGWSGELILAGHTRGNLLIAESIRLEDGAGEIKVNKEIFPTGIAHFTLFTPDRVPVAERLSFIGHEDALTFSPSVSQTGPQSDYIDLRFAVRDHNGDPVRGTFSLSAGTGHAGNNIHQKDLLSFLLLDSDLQGLTTNVYDYIYSGDDHDELIDKLLLTHGWRRFDWKSLLAGELPEIRFIPSTGLSIAGTVTDPARNESLRNYPISLRILKEGQEKLLSTSTGRNGAFAFSGLFFEGNTRVVLTSRRLPGNYPPVIELNVGQIAGYDYLPTIFTREQQITSRGDDWSRQRGASASPYAHTTSRHVTPQLYGTPDQTIYIDYETTTERNLFEVLRHRATGLMFEGNRITIRGPSSMMLSNEPRFMIDGSFIDRNTFLGLYPRDVERVEIFRGTRAAIFGVRGGTGVIIAYSRRPGYQGFEDALDLVMLGYHTPSSFYSDLIAVDRMSSLDKRIGKTIYWDPSLETDQSGLLNVRVPLRGGLDHMVIRLEGAGFGGGIGSAEFNIDIGQEVP